MMIDHRTTNFRLFFTFKKLTFLVGLGFFFTGSNAPYLQASSKQDDIRQKLIQAFFEKKYDVEHQPTLKKSAKYLCSIALGEEYIAFWLPKTDPYLIISDRKKLAAFFVHFASEPIDLIGDLKFSLSEKNHFIYCQGTSIPPKSYHHDTLISTYFKPPKSKKSRYLQTDEKSVFRLQNNFHPSSDSILCFREGQRDYAIKCFSFSNGISYNSFIDLETGRHAASVKDVPFPKKNNIKVHDVIPNGLAVITADEEIYFYRNLYEGPIYLNPQLFSGVKVNWNKKLKLSPKGNYLVVSEHYLWVSHYDEVTIWSSIYDIVKGSKDLLADFKDHAQVVDVSISDNEDTFLLFLCEQKEHFFTSQYLTLVFFNVQTSSEVSSRVTLFFPFQLFSLGELSKNIPLYTISCTQYKNNFVLWGPDKAVSFCYTLSNPLPPPQYILDGIIQSAVWTYKITDWPKSLSEEIADYMAAYFSAPSKLLWECNLHIGNWPTTSFLKTRFYMSKAMTPSIKIVKNLPFQLELQAIKNNEKYYNAILQYMSPKKYFTFPYKPSCKGEYTVHQLAQDLSEKIKHKINPSYFSFYLPVFMHKSKIEKQADQYNLLIEQMITKKVEEHWIKIKPNSQLCLCSLNKLASCFMLKKIVLFCRLSYYPELFESTMPDWAASYR